MSCCCQRTNFRPSGRRYQIARHWPPTGTAVAPAPTRSLAWSFLLTDGTDTRIFSFGSVSTSSSYLVVTDAGTLEKVAETAGFGLGSAGAVTAVMVDGEVVVFTNTVALSNRYFRFGFDGSLLGQVTLPSSSYQWIDGDLLWGFRKGPGETADAEGTAHRDLTINRWNLATHTAVADVVKTGLDSVAKPLGYDGGDFWTYWQGLNDLPYWGFKGGKLIFFTAAKSVVGPPNPVGVPDHYWWTWGTWDPLTDAYAIDLVSGYEHPLHEDSTHYWEVVRDASSLNSGPFRWDGDCYLVEWRKVVRATGATAETHLKVFDFEGAEKFSRNLAGLSNMSGPARFRYVGFNGSQVIYHGWHPTDPYADRPYFRTYFLEPDGGSADVGVMFAKETGNTSGQPSLRDSFDMGGEVLQVGALTTWTSPITAYPSSITA